MNANGQTEMTHLEQLLHAAKVEQMRSQNRALITEYRAITDAEGKVWSELTEEEIMKIIVANETRKELNRQAQEEESAVKCIKPSPITLKVNLDIDESASAAATHDIHRNLCVNCGINMGDDNPRQLCEKTHCPNEKDFFADMPELEPPSLPAPSCADKHEPLFTHTDPRCKGCVCPTLYRGMCLCFVSQYCRDYYDAQKKFPCGGSADCSNETCGCDQSVFNQQCREQEKLEREKDLEGLCDLVGYFQEMATEHLKQTPFQLLEGNAEQAFAHITRLTNQFQGLTEQFVYDLKMRLQSRPVTTFGYLPVPMAANNVKQIIGKDGCYFKLTTNNTDVDFIWHDRVENYFCFWGTKECVLKAMRIILGRINKYAQ